jgi:hypothetical protein
LEFLRGSVAGAGFAPGAAEAGGKDGPSAWQGVKDGDVWRALGARRDGVPGHTPRGDQSLDEERRGGHDAGIGGQGCSALDGADAWVADVGGVPVLVVEEGWQGGATGELPGFEGGPGSQHVAAAARVRVGPPGEDGREGVGPGTGAAMVDEWLKGAQGRALRGEGWTWGARWEQALALALGLSGVVRGRAGRERVAIPREGAGGNGKAHAAVILPRRGDEGAVVECETEGQGVRLEARAHGAHPRRKGGWLVFEDPERTVLRASGFSAAMVFGLSPVDADAGRQRFSRLTRQGSPPGRCEPGEKGQACLRSAPAG